MRTQRRRRLKCKSDEVSFYLNVLLCGFYIFGCTAFVLRLLTVFFCTSRVQSHGKASAESSITSLLVVRGSPRRWRLLMDGSISSFPFCEYPYYTRERRKKLHLFSGRRRTQNGRLFAARIVIQLRYSRSRSCTMRTYFVLHPARSPACNAL